MILLEIREYVRKHKQAALRDVAAKFDLTEGEAAQMLAHWERKGKIVRTGRNGGCGQNCSCCSAPCEATYRWTEN